ncbi:MAG: ATPase domain-containing protein [Candidatus Hydrothermarchaeales archaeon]
MEFVKTGIGGLDAFFAHGGYPKGNSIVVLGGPGSGKSIFAMQYVYNGASQFDEPGVYVTLEEVPEKIRRNMLNFGWDIAGLEEDGKIVIVDATSPRVMAEGVGEDVIEKGLEIENMIANIEDTIKEISAARIVIDSLSVMGIYSKTDFGLRTQLLKMSSALSNMGCTSLVVAEAKKDDIGIREFPPETYMFDGVITLRYDTDSQDRRLAIRKMRGTKHVLGAFKFSISDDGIGISP